MSLDAMVLPFVKLINTPSCRNVMCAQLKCQHNQIFKMLDVVKLKRPKLDVSTMCQQTAKPHNTVCPASPCREQTLPICSLNEGNYFSKYATFSTGIAN
jgi:hypothetical protein